MKAVKTSRTDKSATQRKDTNINCGADIKAITEINPNSNISAKMQTQANRLIKRIRTMVWIIIIGLALSGITAFPLETEIGWLLHNSTSYPDILHNWLTAIYSAIKTTNANFPYLSYAADLLAFAHLMLAVLFYGPLRDPIKNSWVIEFGMIACLAIVPLALIAGPIRHIPLFWRLIDCSFGGVAIIPLGIGYSGCGRLESLKPYIRGVGAV
ncbi:MAG: hypothetical protein V4594_03800 [Bacteroidota bacterium]